VLAISLVTNPAAGLSAAPLDHGDVVRAAGASAARIGQLLGGLIPRL
jgi:purine-nucleoside phosphorylase